MFTTLGLTAVMFPCDTGMDLKILC